MFNAVVSQNDNESSPRFCYPKPYNIVPVFIPAVDNPEKQNNRGEN